MTTLQTIFNRLREPSSMAGIAALAVLFGVPPGTGEVIAQSLAALAAVAAILIPEKGGA